MKRRRFTHVNISEQLVGQEPFWPLWCCIISWCQKALLVQDSEETEVPAQRIFPVSLWVTFRKLWVTFSKLCVIFTVTCATAGSSNVGALSWCPYTVMESSCMTLHSALLLYRVHSKQGTDCGSILISQARCCKSKLCQPICLFFKCYQCIWAHECFPLGFPPQFFSTMKGMLLSLKLLAGTFSQHLWRVSIQ